MRSDKLKTSHKGTSNLRFAAPSTPRIQIYISFVSSAPLRLCVSLLFIFILLLSLTGCPHDSVELPKPPLTGTVSLNNNTPKVGDSIIASYNTGGNGTGSRIWQWFRVEGGAEVLIAGADSNRYTATPEDIGKRLRAQLSFTDQSASVGMTTRNAVVPATLSGDLTIIPNRGVTINTELNAIYTGNEDVTYHWRKDDIDVGENSPVYMPTEIGGYMVTVSAAGYSIKTSETVDVSDPSLPSFAGTLTISPDTDVVVGMELTATYVGAEPVTLSYQWHKDGANVGGNANTYTPTEPGSYNVTISAAGYNPKTSANVIVTDDAAIPDLPGDITISPNTGVTVGMMMTATYTGSESVSYQWQRDGYNVSGGNTASYTTVAVGSYTVIVSAAGYNSKTSAAVTVTQGVQYWAVTWNLNGGTMAAGTEAQYLDRIVRDTALVRPNPDPVKNGSDFGGWYTDSGLTQAYNFANPVTAPLNLHARWMNVGAREVTIAMWDDASDGWDDDAALRINVNGTDRAQNARVAAGYTSEYHFDVELNDLVRIYFVAGGSYNNEIAFAAYYADAPPSPAFDPTHGTSDYDSLLVYKLFDSLTNTAPGTLLGSFTCAYTLSGNVTVTPNGFVSTGTTLTASYSGSENVGFQWQKDGADIPGANTAVYTPSAAGSYAVRVSMANYNSKTSGAVIVGVSLNSLADFLTWMQTNAQSNSAYIYNVTANESIAPQTLEYAGKSNITITLRGSGGERTITTNAAGALFILRPGVNLVLDNNITLQGYASNNNSVVVVYPESTLVMNNGAKITGNNFSVYPLSASIAKRGGGVYVAGGVFTMNGGEISGNTVSYNGDGGTVYGGGVYVNIEYLNPTYFSGTFIMNGGKISNNTVTGNYSGEQGGGGVFVSEGCTFTMNGGEISGNTASYTHTFSGYSARGGGLYMMGNFIMNGGEIFGNTVSVAAGGQNARGGGVFLAGGTFFRLINGKIRDNILSGGNQSGKEIDIYDYSGSAQHGTYSGVTWVSQGDLILEEGWVNWAIEDPVVVINGARQP